MHALLIVLVLLVVGVGVIWWGSALPVVIAVVPGLFYVVHQSNKRARDAKIRSLQTEAAAFFSRPTREACKPLETGLILQKDEQAIHEEESALYETRAFRVYGGAGTRIGRVYVGGGSSESRSRWKQIDTGRLTLTTKRLVFDGQQENRVIRLSDILSVWPSALDAIEISSQRRAKSAVFTVSNPLIWAPLIEQAAKGTITVSEGVVARPGHRPRI